MTVTKASLGIGELHFSNSPARRHTKKQLRKAVHMFAEQGIISPIVVDRSYRIIDGHLRVMAARELGIEALDALVLPDISDAQRIELELALNRLPEDSTWDAANLKIKIEQLIEYNVDLTFTGFETAEIDNILSFEVIEAEDQDWTATDPVNQVGDIWRVGDHILACGNALSPGDVLGGVLDGLEPAKACITDPPYNVPTSGHIRTTQKHAEFAMAAGEMGDQDFTEFLSRSIKASLPYMDTTALFYLFMDWRHVGNLNAAAKYNGLIQQNLCVWSKTNAGMGSFYRSQHELVGVYSRSDRFQNNIQLGSTGRYRTNVWVYDGVNSFSATRTDDLTDHPTIKPTQMLADIILDCTSIGDWVYDPFLGSGSTCQAAEQTRRRCLGIEYEPRYVDVALKRLKDRCGLDAIHLASDLSYAEIAAERQTKSGVQA
jgi:DNA modification methylase